MIRPAFFGFDAETAETNRFQSEPGAPPLEVHEKAVVEFDRAVGALRGSDVEVLVADDLADPRTPDAVFPNNWISTHHDGTVVLYPMLTTARRLERRDDVINRMCENFIVRRVVDLSPNEVKGRFLEGTGSLVFDYPNRTVYAALSPRTHPGMVEEAGAVFSCETVVFRATDSVGREIYHTNVVMALGEQFAILASESIEDAAQRTRVLGGLAATGREILEITPDQMVSFAANVLEVRSTDGHTVLAASERAWDALTVNQRETLAGLTRVVHVPIPTIEAVGGGSLRCMIAEIFLPRRSHS